jgi:DNA-binding response OmpR family regulator
MTTPLVAVVDDDARIRDLLAAELEDLGAEVLRCRSGSDLLKATELNDVQLVLLDWMMPGLNGEATLLELRTRQFSGRVVVVTALCDPQVRATAQAAGAAATLLKTEALEQLEHWLNQG